VQANFFHPNDKRKLVNCLFTYLKTGKSAAPLSRLRFLPIIVWVHADKDLLQTRVNTRILEMLQMGGLKEALDLFDSLKTFDFEKGILQSIGYKEFYPVYQLHQPDQVLAYLQTNTPCPNS
jgi:tRNA dimethylallyltransferase